MKKLFRLTLVPLFVLLSPLISAAQAGTPDLSVIRPYSNAIISFINSILVPILVAIAFVVFLWGVSKYYIYETDNESERSEGHRFMLWGIIGLVVILAVWGLVNMVAGAFGLQLGGGAPFQPPRL